MTEINMDNFAQSLIGKSPYAIYQAIRDLDKEKGEGTAMSLLQNSPEFSKYCSQQMKAFLDNRMALTKRDAENIDKWWKFSTNDFSLEDIKKAYAKIENGEYIRSDHFIDFDKSKNFKLFKDNIQSIKYEMRMPNTQNKDIERHRINKRQRIVDFARLMSRESETQKLIEANNWEPIRNEFSGFPKMPMSFLLKRYNKSKQHNIEHPEKQKTEEEAFFSRIVEYRIKDIIYGNRKTNLEELQLAEEYIKSFNRPDDENHQALLTKLDEMKKGLEATQAENESVETKAKETNSQAKEENVVEDVSQPVEEQHNENEPSTELVKPQLFIINEFYDENSQQLTKQDQIIINENIPQNTDVATEEIIPSADEIIEQVENNENSNDVVEEIAVPNDSYKEDDSAVEAPEEAPQKIEEEVQVPLKQPDKKPASWQDKTLSDWKEWSKKSNKVVQEYKPKEQAVLAFKVYDNEEKAKADEYDADITYRKENDVVIKGYKGKVPSDEVFANIVAQAKKNGSEICFGDIKSSVFKAKLMLACLNDKDVKMVNPPKLSELSDLPEDLKVKLKEKLPRPADRAKERMDKLNKEKTGHSRYDGGNKGSSDKSSERPRRDGKFRSDKNSREGKSFRPRNEKSSELNPALQRKISEKSNGI